MKGLCVIPARGGSKRIPRKNLRPFLGKPIILYTVEAALSSGLFDAVMVSTDDAEIAELSRDAGAEVPFLRSPKTANDQAGLADVVIEVLDQYEAQGTRWDTVCCALATSPWLTAERLIEASCQLDRPGVAAVVPVVEYEFPIERSLILGEDRRLEFARPEHRFTRSQDLAPRYHDAGQFYFLHTRLLRKERSLIPNGSTALLLDRMEAQDIDTEEDWKLAELKFRLRTDTF